LSQLAIEELPSVLHYWASLIGGAIDEALARYANAGKRYESALTLFPHSQAASIALSRVRIEHLDEHERGAADLRLHIRPSISRTFDSDPWWFYRLGQAWRANDWLKELQGLK